MKKKSILALICASLMAAAPLAGCGGGGGGGSEWWSTTGELKFDSNGKVVFKNEVINLTTVVSGEDSAAFQSLVEQFNEVDYFGKIKVNVNNVSQTKFEETVGTAISQNYNAPDLIMSHQKEHNSYVKTQLVQPFESSWMQESGIEFDLNDYSSGLTQYASAGYEGKIFSLPCDAQSMAVYYNRDMLKELGEVDGQGNDILPKNHEELLALGQKCAAAGKQLISWTTQNQEHFYSYVFNSAIVQNGGKLYNENTKRAEWASGDNKKAFEKAIKSIRDLIYSDTTPTFAPSTPYSTDDAKSLEAFTKKNALFYVYLPWRIESLTSTCKTEWGFEDSVDNHIGTTSIANWFALKDEETGEYPAHANKLFVDSHYFAMSRTVKDVTKKAAILEFIKWFTQTPGVAKKWARAGHVTAYKPIFESTDYQNDYYVKNYINKFYPDINNFVCMGNTPYSADLKTTLTSLAYGAFNTKDVNISALITGKQNELNGTIDGMDILG